MNYVMQLTQERKIILRTGELVYANGPTGTADALAATEAAGLEPQYAPDVANYRSNAPTDINLWRHWIITPSICATGVTTTGSKVVVYAHVPNYYSNHEHLRSAASTRRLYRGAGPLPQPEFQRLVDLEGVTDDRGVRQVYIVDYDTLRRSPSGGMTLDQALHHPQTVPFIGSEEGAQAYLKARRSASYGQKHIGMWHADDFDEASPMARLLVFGGDGSGGLLTDVLYHTGRFLGVVPIANAPRSTHANPTLQQVIGAIRSDLPEIDVNALTRVIEPLYRQ